MRNNVNEFWQYIRREYPVALFRYFYYTLNELEFETVAGSGIVLVCKLDGSGFYITSPEEVR